ncbi:ubiquitin-conjugating enzyme E2 T-like isoform X2 [Venturia canescens]|nr:ubiquitin-conjugating enzyme E2 T-like isoform X2 [Venturia canescens]XP_043270090.1 ubiquitin-conjugating enzyme E2 T-like isoform X2 [Venturia canescens]
MQNHRIKREMAKLVSNPPEGISCHPKSDKTNLIMVYIVGPHKSPYEGGIFELELEVDNSYPFEPPRLKFSTPIYHPNIDTSGRICMDLLKMPPKGGWKPTITLENLLVAAQWLLGNPNPDDPLMPDIATEYKINRMEFDRKARKYTQAHAKKNTY